MKQSYPMEVASRFSVDADALLAPVPGEDEAAHGVGISLRYDAVYPQIREARTQDDASVPMGEWERPLIKADWKRVAALCADAIATRSKDFQLAAWLCEAWTHLHHIEGLIAGTRVMTALAERYWEHAWPELEPGDTEARVGPFMWLNDTLAMVLTLEVPLVTIEGREPGFVNLDEWQRVITGAMDDEDDEPGTAREALDKQTTRGGNLAALVALHQQLEAGIAAWDAFGRMLDDRLGHDAPHLGRVRDVLMRLAQAVTSLIGDRALPVQRHLEPVPVPVAVESNGYEPMASEAIFAPVSGERAMSDILLDSAIVAPATPILPAVHAGAVANTARVESRAHAYQLLELVARYLSEHEPHSPTPFLLRRAVQWGQMPLPELMREIVRTEGDMSRYLSMLGVE
ncbi:type VI secretion system protein TssA [Paraburkholderia acidisoli]|uniref:Type VI secretion system protein TssA n=1 Tax=Paraburkholderia acidisoli TaxID=2571748 RepID=A0A7Z2GN96_9BURK|nr:type VI secretion system protein TssA [Paraburkholderia acidisoli]QGZ64843.1 type VI secretion system protein TssA [Paraburkholderia acidisoli]